jgi:hypothetical protein
MNPEFERLIDIMLSDGFLDDSERELLLKRAKHLGYDDNEAEMMLDIKQQGRRNQLNNNRDIIEGEKEPSTVNFSYRENDNYGTLLKSLNSKISQQGQDSNGSFTIRGIKILFTGGLYMFYKLLIRREPLFNGLVTKTNPVKFNTILYSELALITTATPEVTRDDVNRIQKDLRSTLRRIIWRQFKSSFFMLFIFIILPISLLYFSNKFIKYSEAKSRKQDSIAAIKKADLEKENGIVKSEISTESARAISEENTLKTADSLFNTGNYNDAFEMGKLINYDKQKDFYNSKAFELLKLKKNKLARKYFEETGMYRNHDNRFDLADYLASQKK